MHRWVSFDVSLSDNEFYKIDMQLQPIDFETLSVLNCGFRWVRPDKQ
jgi:hypothetical protein